MIPLLLIGGTLTFQPWLPILPSPRICQLHAGIKSSHLNEIGCNESLLMACHYYTKCPEPELTMGVTKHTNEGFLTLLLQDHIPALQVRHQNEWIDVPPVRGALIINVANTLQLITNDRFKSVDHRLVANSVRSRVSVACSFSTSVQPSSRLYKPIRELLSEDNPAKYRETTLQEFKRTLLLKTGLMEFPLYYTFSSRES